MKKALIIVTTETDHVYILNRFNTLDEAIEARKKYDVWVKEYYDIK